MRGRGRSPKGCTELSGAIIYDDLPSAPSIVPARGTHRGPPGSGRHHFKPVPMVEARGEEEMMGMTMGVHLYTPEPRSNAPSEHLYHTISSGSESCSYSTSEAAGQDGRALLRPQHPRTSHVRAAAASLAQDTDSEDEHLASLGGVGENLLLGEPCSDDNDTPSTSPGHSRYYCPSAPPAPDVSSSPGGSSDYESVYYVGGNRRGLGRPRTPQERGLPPLPSRTDRFRIYFSVDRGGGQQQPYRKALGRRRGTDRRHLHQNHRPPEAEPLYQNVT